MADDDEAGGEIPFDPTFATSGPRRSTFTPPTGSTPAVSNVPGLHDDDALADALAADLSRMNTGVIPIPGAPEAPEVPTQEAAAPEVPTQEAAAPEVPTQEAAAPEAPTQEAVAPEAPVAPTAPEPPVQVVPPAYSVADSYPAVPSFPVEATGPIDSLPEGLIPTPPIPTQPNSTQDSVPPPSASPAWQAPAPWSTFPAPDPSQAVLLPDPLEHLVRQALPEEQPVAVADAAADKPSATLEAIQQLQAQFEQRDQEARGLRERESNPQPPESFIDNPVTPWPFPNYDDEAPADPPPYADPEPPVYDQPAYDQAAFDQPAYDEPGLPGAQPPYSFDPAPPGTQWEQSLPEAEITPPLVEPAFVDPVAVELPPVEAPPGALPAWEVPAPGPNWSPGPEFGIDTDTDPEPEVQAPATEAPTPDLPVDLQTATEAPAADLPVDLQTATEAPAPEAPATEAPATEAPATEAPAPDLPVDLQTPPWLSHPDETADPDAVIEAEIVAEPEQVETFERPEPYSPPPLIEPMLHGPPVLPSQVASHPPTGASPLPGAGALPDTWPPPAEQADLPAADAVEQPPAAPAPATPPVARQFSFDDLLSGPGDEPGTEEPPLRRDPEPRTAADAAPSAIFIEPMSVAAGEPVPTDTGSITIIDQAYEEELPDDVDETDRAAPGLGAVSVDTSGIAVVTGTIHPPSGPISTVRIPEDEVVLSDGEPVRMKVFTLEDSGLDATPVDHRVGRAARLFWLWFAANSSILSLGLGATVFAVGMSLRQSIVAILAGVALSFIPLGLTTLAGKRSGQPTMVVSRATFGLLGNVVPAILALVTRLFWGAVLLWLLASSVAIILVGAQLDGAIGERQLLLISLAIAFLVALLVAFAGYPLFARIQLILSVVSAILVVGLIAITWKYVDFAVALTTPDGSWVLTVTGAVLVFSVVGLVWANSGADLARYQRPATSGAASMLWATIGTTLPTFMLIGYGALLAASDQGIASGFLLSPLDTLSLMLPNWYPVPLLAATGLSLLSGVILTLYSGGFALQAIGVKVRRQWSIVIVGVLLGAFALLLTFGVTGGTNELFRDAATTLAVPTAAWAGIFAAETMIRNRRYDSQSLLVRGGVYADVRWLNLIALFVISAIGFGLTTATVTWLGWQGYGFTLLGMPLGSDLATSDVGVLVALVLGLLVPLVAGVRAIRRQEALRG